MKIGTCNFDGHDVPVVITDDGKSYVTLSELGYAFSSVNDLIRNNNKEMLQQIMNKANAYARKTPLLQSQLAAPIPYPIRDVVCMGLNYLAHAREMEEALEEKRTSRIWPIFFGKAVDRCRGTGEGIPSHKDFVSTLDYECELAVILGKNASHVKREDVPEYIFGYSILNDITARELSRYKQNYFMKSLDGTCPMGPWIVTADEISYPPKLGIKLYVNGNIRQQGNTEDMIFDIADIVSELSKGVTLPAGTIISTGTPPGIGFAMNPPVFLQDGDRIKCEIEHIGVLENTVKD